MSENCTVFAAATCSTRCRT